MKPLNSLAVVSLMLNSELMGNYSKNINIPKSDWTHDEDGMIRAEEKRKRKNQKRLNDNFGVK